MSRVSSRHPGRSKSKVATYSGAVLLSTLALFCGSGGEARANEAVAAEAVSNLNIARSARQEITKAAILLAKLGLSEESNYLLEILQRTGESERKVLSTRGRINKELEKSADNPLRGRTRNASIDKAISSVEKFKQLILGDLHRLDSNLAKGVLQILIRLDSQDPRVGEKLGYRSDAGNWIHPKEYVHRVNTAPVENVVAQARSLKFKDQIEVGVGDHPALRGVCKKDAVFARYKDAAGKTIAFWSCDQSQEELQSSLSDLLRALALLNKQLGGDLTPALGANQEYIRIQDKGEWKLSLDRSQQAGHLNAPNDSWLIAYKEKGFYWDNRGFMAANNQPSSFLRGCTRYAIRDFVKSKYGKVLPQIEKGLIEWASIRILGTVGSKGMVEETSSRDRHSPTVTQVDKTQEELFLRLGKSSANGSRLLLEFLQANGRLPQWPIDIPKDLDEITGNERLKCAYMIEYLSSIGKLEDFVQATKSISPGQDSELLEAVFSVLAQSKSELESDFKIWLRATSFKDSSIGLAQRLEELKEDLSKTTQIGTQFIELLHAIRSPLFSGRDLPQVFELPELSSAAEAHARYLHLNPDQFKYPEGHTESPDLEGYSLAGQRAAGSSIIVRAASLEDGVNHLMSTFYHRRPFLRPNNFGIGVGFHEGILVIDMSTAVDPRKPKADFSVWPYDGAVDVPRSFQIEAPNPLPGRDISKMGYPVSIEIMKGKDIDLSKVKVELFLGEPGKGRVVPGVFITPQNNPQEEFPFTRGACFIPEEPLEKRQQYTVVITGLPGGVQTVEFKTRKN